MWRDFLSVIGFVFTAVALAVAILTWYQITPKRFGEITRDRLIRSWLIWPILVTVIAAILFIFYLMGHVYTWWSYVELALVCLYFWLIYITRKPHTNNLFDKLIWLVPGLYLVPGLGRIENVLNTSVFDRTSPNAEKWLYIGLLLLNMLFIGINLGFGLYHAFMSRLINDIEKNCKECQSIQNKAKEALEKAEKVINECKTNENNVTT